MGYEQEFATVDLILASKFETRGVDAFILSFIKAEKQMRRIFTYLVFQSPFYTIDDYESLRKTLAENKRIYFDNFIKGIDLILSTSVKEIYDSDYDSAIKCFNEITKERNKIFHGQITENGLTRDKLIERIEFLKSWCQNIGNKFSAIIGFDGFSDSYIKSKIGIKLKNTDKFNTIDRYKKFLGEIL